MKISEVRGQNVTSIENGGRAGTRGEGRGGGNKPAFTPMIRVYVCLARVLKPECGICLVLIL